MTSSAIRNGLTCCSIVALLLAGVPYEVTTNAVAGGSAGTSDRKLSQEVLVIARELRKAVLNADTKTLLKYIVLSKENFHSYEEARQTLEHRQSGIHCLLFDTQCHLEHVGDAPGNPFKISIADFFRRHPTVNIRVRLIPVNQSNARYLAHILYLVPGSDSERRFRVAVSDEDFLAKWGIEFVDACLEGNSRAWRYQSGAAGVFVCATE